MNELPVPLARNLHVKTPLVNRGRPCACVVTPDSDEMISIGGMVATFLGHDVGLDLPVVTAAEYAESPRLRRHHVIALGDLTTNPILAELYIDGRHCVDRSFPGPAFPKGYLIKSIHNPLGVHRNYFLLGGSEAQGVRQAAEALCEVLSALEDRTSLPPTLCCVTGHTRPAPPEMEALREKAKRLRRLREDGEIDAIIEEGLVEPLSHFDVAGDFRWTLLPRLALEVLWSGGTPDGPADHIVRPEAWLADLVVTWDNVEEFPAFTANDRERMVELLGMAAVRVEAEWAGTLRGDRGPIPLWRRAAAAALGLFEAGRYFGAYYEWSRARDWLDLARAYFALPRRHVHTADLGLADTCACLRHALVFSFRSRISLVAPRGLHRIAQELGAFLDVSGLPVSVGWPPLAPEALAAVSNMLAWASRDLPLTRLPDPLGRTTAVRAPVAPMAAFYSDRRRQWPQRSPGAMVFWLDPLTPEWAGRLPAGQREGSIGHWSSVIGHGPAGAVEQPFRSLALRSGFRSDDDYLLLSGLGDPAEGRYTAGSVIHLQLAGESVAQGEAPRASGRFRATSVHESARGSAPLACRAAGIAEVPSDDREPGRTENEPVSSSRLRPREPPAGVGVRLGEDAWTVPGFASMRGVLGAGTLWGAVVEFPVEHPGTWRRAVLQVPREGFAILDLFRAPTDGKWELASSVRTLLPAQETASGIRLAGSQGEAILRTLATGAVRTECRSEGPDELVPGQETAASQIRTFLSKGLKAQELMGCTTLWGRAGAKKTFPSGARMLAPDVLVLETALGQRHLIWLGFSPLRLMEMEGDFAALVLNEYLGLWGVRRLALPHASLESDHPISLLFDPSERRCEASAQWPALVVVGARGRRVHITLEAGERQVIDFPVPISEYEELQSRFEAMM